MFSVKSICMLMPLLFLPVTYASCTSHSSCHHSQPYPLFCCALSPTHLTPVTRPVTSFNPIHSPPSHHHPVPRRFCQRTSPLTSPHSSASPWSYVHAPSSSHYPSVRIRSAVSPPLPHPCQHTQWQASSQLAPDSEVVWGEAAGSLKLVSVCWQQTDDSATKTRLVLLAADR